MAKRTEQQLEYQIVVETGKYKDRWTDWVRSTDRALMDARIMQLRLMQAEGKRYRLFLGGKITSIELFSRPVSKDNYWTRVL